MTFFSARGHIEDRQMVQHMGASITLSGQTSFNQGIYNTYFYNSYEDFLNGVSGGTGYLDLIATSGDTFDEFSGYTLQPTLQPGIFRVQPPVGVVYSGNSSVVSGYTNQIDVTGYLATAFDSTGLVIWTPLSGVTAGSCDTITNTITPCGTGDTVTINGNLRVVGQTISATTIIETETVLVEDNSIEMNYGGNHTSAIGGGLVVLSGVSNTQNSTIATDSNGVFVFDPGLSSPVVSACTAIHTSNLYGCSPITVHAHFQTNTSTATTTNNYVNVFGNLNSSSSDWTFIAGGNDNIINTGSDRSSILGGRIGTLTGEGCLIGGGRSNTVIGTEYDTILNGESNTLQSSGGRNTILNGNSHTISGASFSSILGGQSNQIYGDGTPSATNASIIGGNTNLIEQTDDTTIIGGRNHTIFGSTADRATIIGGDNSYIASEGSNAVILGGSNHIITGTSANGSVIIGSTSGIIKSSDAGIFLTNNGTIQDNGSFQSINSVLLGGKDSIITRGWYSGILGGDSNFINSVDRSVILGGQGITATTNDTAYVPNLNIGTVSSGTLVNNLGIDSNGKVIIGITGDTSYWTVENGGLKEINATSLTLSNTSTDSFMGGGNSNNLNNSPKSAIIGGNDHDMVDSRGTIIIGGSNNNILSGDSNTIIGGSSHDIVGMGNGYLNQAGIFCGSNNNIVDTTVDSARSVIIGGVNNDINDSSDSIILGSSLSDIINTSVNGFILGSVYGKIDNSDYSGIIGGGGFGNPNIVDGVNRSVIIGGQGITATTNDTVYVPTLNIGSVFSGTGVTLLGVTSGGTVIAGNSVYSEICDTCSGIFESTGTTIDTGTTEVFILGSEEPTKVECTGTACCSKWLLKYKDLASGSIKEEETFSKTRAIKLRQLYAAYEKCVDAQNTVPNEGGIGWGVPIVEPVYEVIPVSSGIDAKTLTTKSATEVRIEGGGYIFTKNVVDTSIKNSWSIAVNETQLSNVSSTINSVITSGSQITLEGVTRTYVGDSDRVTVSASEGVVIQNTSLSTASASKDSYISGDGTTEGISLISAKNITADTRDYTIYTSGLIVSDKESINPTTLEVRTSTNDCSLIVTSGGTVGVKVCDPAFDLEVGGSFGATSKSFIIPHPTKEGKRLVHGAIEGPEFGVYYRGKINGKVIDLPEYWTELVHEDTITVQLTAIGGSQNLYIEKIENNKVFINSSGWFSSPHCYYTVYGERKDIDKIKTEIDA